MLNPLIRRFPLEAAEDQAVTQMQQGRQPWSLALQEARQHHVCPGGIPC